MGQLWDGAGSALSDDDLLALMGFGLMIALERE
jgi:hypothetical protein